MLSALTAAVILAAEPLFLPAVFGDRMVLQRERPIPVFGTAAPNTPVEVILDRETVRTKAGGDGAWQVRLKARKAGGPYTLTVKTPEATRTFRDVLIGEVWVCSGQSNMEWPVELALHSADEKASADPNVRMLTVGRDAKLAPQKDFATNGWVVASPQTVGSFSAVGYFFGRKLSQELKVPIGLIHTSWGGTPAESWTSPEALASDPVTRRIYDSWRASQGDLPAKMEEYHRLFRAWRDRAFPQEKVVGTPAYATVDAWSTGWDSFPGPGAWETVWKRPFDGAVWFQIPVEVPPAWSGKDLMLNLGPIDDTDVTFFNGVRVGETDSHTPEWWAANRRYTVPGKLVNSGRNFVAVRVMDTGGNGGIMGPAGLMSVHPVADDRTKLPLAGEWRVKIEAELMPPPADLGPEPQRPVGEGDGWLPGGLMHAMVHPMIPYGIRGAIWYQGESNAGRAYQYRTLFPMMIQDWRKRWGQGDFPFYWVSLANFMERSAVPVEDAWAELREAQTMALKLPNTGQALAIDLGEAGDIHPRNKQDVGSRLALNALAKTYGRRVEFSGPVYRKMEVKGAEVWLDLDHAEGLGTSDGAAPRGFALAGADRRFGWAEARIVGNRIRLTSPQVDRPAAVRYGWHSNPDVNVVNAAGLPMTPFRTDDWPGVTQGAG